MIEHILSALAGNGIFNAKLVIEDLAFPNKREQENHIDLPLLDGSSLPYIQAFEDNIKELEVPQKFLVPKETIYYNEGNSILEISPLRGEGKNSYFIHVDWLKRDNQNFSIDNCLFEVYNKEIAPARTFGRINYDRDMYKGATIDSCIGYDAYTGMIYQGKDFLRFSSELIRHKLLDLIGDLSVIGYPIKAKIEASNPNHDFNRHFCKYLLKDCREQFALV